MEIFHVAAAYTTPPACSSRTDTCEAMSSLAVVVGAGPGLGAALARTFAAHHSAVAVLGRTLKTVEGVADDVRKSGGDANAFACDVTDAQSVQDAFAAIKQKWPSHQLRAALFNANSPFIMKPFLELTSEDIKPGVDVNSYGAFNFSQKVIPLMLEAGGGFLGFTGATAAIKGSAKFAALAPGKFALRGLAQNLAREFGPQGVHVSHVMVDGLIDTERVRGMMGSGDADSRIDPNAIAETFLNLAQQPRSCWTHEVDVRPFAEKWLIAQQDELVFAAVKEKMDLEAELDADREEWGDNGRGSDDEKVEAEREQEALERQIEAAREAYTDMNSKKEEVENLLSHFDSRIIETHERVTNASQESAQVSARRPVPVDGPLATVVFINGANAPFADELIRRGKEGGREASKTLRENLVAQNPDHVVLVHLWYDRRLLMQSLQHGRIISAPSTWNSFIWGFCREPLAAAANSSNTIERVVFAGMHPSAGVFDSLLTLEDANETLPATYTQGILPHVEIIDHLPEIPKPDFGFPTLTIPGEFGSSISKPFAIRSPEELTTEESASRTQPLLSPESAPASQAAGRARSVASSAVSRPATVRAAPPTRAPFASTSTGHQRRPLNPNRGFTNQDPPLCYYFYLNSKTGCIDRRCQRSHDYDLNERQVQRLRQDVKRFPCKAWEKTGTCDFQARNAGQE
ncbi:hypothetical protein JCM8115_005261 [Rhodotorula mucilaginosa]